MLHGEVSEAGHLACNGEKNAWALVWFTVKKSRLSNRRDQDALPCQAPLQGEIRRHGVTCEKGLKN